MSETYEMENYPYGKSVFKTFFFAGASATIGAIYALPSLSFEAIINAGLESGTAGLLVGGAMMAVLAIMQKEPHVNLKVVVPALATSVMIAQNYLTVNDEVSENLTF